ncbi:MAG: hypothetical protein Q7T26_00290 [Dehalococcoidia bacterium]|nr:hypothetical protein [Dehalococcoidia bacterium]
MSPRTSYIVNPVAPVPTLTQEMAPPVGELAGKTAAFIDNGWASLGVTLDTMERLLKERHGVAKVIRVKNPDLTRPLAAGTMDQLAKEADIAIVGLGN